MKYNLKNRPKPVRYTAGIYAGFYKDASIEKMDEWFEGFEKELQEMIRPEMKCCNHHFPNGWNAAIKEILGEAYDWEEDE